MKAAQHKGSILLLATLAVAISGVLKRSKTSLDTINASLAQTMSTRKPMDPWKPGLLDIHHLHVGSSVASFIITPDGTTILVDAGELDVEGQQTMWNKMGRPFNRLKAVGPFPDSSKRPSEWIVDYMHHFWPKLSNQSMLELNYLLVTHLHSDHVSGIPTVADHTKIGKLIDRGYPDYAFPKILSKAGDPTIDQYLQFVNSASSSISFEKFLVGSTRQIAQVQQPDDPLFQIQVLKSGATVLRDDGSTGTTEIKGTILDGGEWNENTMSAAFTIKYGDFVYYEGGDQEIIRNEKKEIVFDAIGPTARAAGKVDVASLNHHGHGITKEFVEVTDPEVLILQGWCSDQPTTTSIGLLKGKGRQLFATYIFPDRLKQMGKSLAKGFLSKEGHVVVRVHPPPEDQPEETESSKEKQEYEVYVLDGDRRIKSQHVYYPVLWKRRHKKDKM